MTVSGDIEPRPTKSHQRLDWRRMDGSPYSPMGARGPLPTFEICEIVRLCTARAAVRSTVDFRLREIDALHFSAEILPQCARRRQCREGVGMNIRTMVAAVVAGVAV